MKEFFKIRMTKPFLSFAECNSRKGSGSVQCNQKINLAELTKLLVSTEMWFMRVRLKGSCEFE